MPSNKLIMSKKLIPRFSRKESQEFFKTLNNRVNQYIKDHKLPQGEIIKPDKKLKGLLKVESNEEVTYFNIQKYMNKHFL